MVLPADYSISCELGAQQIDRIHAYLTQSYWAEKISFSIVERAVQNSLCVGVFFHGEQVGFARVVTDSATFAYLCDVYVLEEHRGRKLSSAMLKVLAAHPRLQRLRRFTLATRDAHGLYAKHGFRPLSRPESFMEIVRPELYKELAQRETAAHLRG